MLKNSKCLINKFKAINLIKDKCNNKQEESQRIIYIYKVIKLAITDQQLCKINNYLFLLNCIDKFLNNQITIFWCKLSLWINNSSNNKIWTTSRICNSNNNFLHQTLKIFKISWDHLQMMITLPLNLLETNRSLMITHYRGVAFHLLLVLIIVMDSITCLLTLHYMMILLRTELSSQLQPI